jgi:hypothetical protein
VFTSTVIYDARRSLVPDGTAAPYLRAAYQGTYMAAVLTRAPRVVLTLIGGASFCNPLGQIAQAIAEAHKVYGPLLAPGCEVLLPVYMPKSPFPALLTKLLPSARLVQVE